MGRRKSKRLGRESRESEIGWREIGREGRDRVGERERSGAGGQILEKGDWEEEKREESTKNEPEERR